MTENLLKYTTFSELKICELLNISRKTIHTINTGKHRHSNKNNIFPIREKHNCISEWLFNKIILELQNNNLTMKEIEDKYNISHSTLSRLNQGKTLIHNNINYPIRNYKKQCL